MKWEHDHHGQANGGGERQGDEAVDQGEARPGEELSSAQAPADLARVGRSGAGNHSYLSASTGSSWAARVAGTVPKITPTRVAEARAMTTDQGEMGMA